MITSAQADTWAVGLGGIGVVIWDAADTELPEMHRIASLRNALRGLECITAGIEAAIRLAEGGEG